jgi:hypothetical protein
MRKIRKTTRSRHTTTADRSKRPDKTPANGHTRPHQEVTPKKALAEAICYLAPDATHADLVHFAKEQFGLDLRFVIIIPKSTLKMASQGGRASRSRARRKVG